MSPDNFRYVKHRKGSQPSLRCAVQIQRTPKQGPHAFLQKLYRCFDIAAVWAWRSEPLGFACLQETLWVTTGLMEMGLLTEVRQLATMLCS